MEGESVAKNQIVKQVQLEAHNIVYLMVVANAVKYKNVKEVLEKNLNFVQNMVVEIIVNLLIVILLHQVVHNFV